MKEEEEDNESRWPSSKQVCGSWNAKKKKKLKQQTTRKQARKERREMELTGEKYGCGKSVRQGKHKRATCLWIACQR
jgi:hypothetical protein